MTTFKVHQDVAVVEHDDATRTPRKDGRVIHTSVHAVNEVFTVIGGDREPWDEHPALFDTSSGWGAMPGYHWRLVPVCHRSEEPITGTPVTAADDPLGRQWCRDECLDAAAEASYEQRYQPGVAT